MMHVMTSSGLAIALLAFLILAVGGVLVAVRVYAARSVKDDHPR